MKRSYIVILLMQLAFIAVMAPRAEAVPVQPGVTTVLNGDGTLIKVRIYGDEYFHYTLTENGYLIEMAGEGPNKGYYVYAYTDSDGMIRLTDERVGTRASLAAAKSGSGVSRRQIGMPESARMLAMERRARMVDENMQHTFAANRMMRAAGGAPEITDRKGVVILVEFPDLKFKFSKNDVEMMLNQEGYSANGARGSAADYFRENSNGKLNYTFDVYGPVEVSQGFAYYGQNGSGGGDLRAAECFAEAANIASDNGLVDFSQYDQDGDGEVDMVFFFFAGPSESRGAPANHIWPHKWNFTEYNAGGYNLNLNGKRLNIYASTSELRGNTVQSNEMDGIGLFCHEFSHVLGLADIYDTNSSTDGTGVGMQSYCLMDAGSYNLNATAPPYYMAFERLMIGWIDREDIKVDDKDAYRYVSIDNVRNDGALLIPTKISGYYYIVESRTRSGWDIGIPTSGVLVYQIDQSGKTIPGTSLTAKQMWSRNMPNGVAKYQCAEILKANNKPLTGAASYTQQRGWVYPSKENNSITPDTKPSSVSRWNNNDFFYLTEITYNSDGTASFILGQPVVDLTKDKPFVAIEVPSEGFSAGSALKLSDVSDEAESVVWYVDGKESQTLVKGDNVEIKAVVTLKGGETETIVKITPVK